MGAWAQNTRQQIGKTANTALSTVKNAGSAAWEWMDQHQVVTSVGIGLAVGAAVVLTVGTGGLAAPLIAAGLGAVAMGGLTAGLNVTHDRPWNQNLVRNTVLAGGTAALVPLAVGPFSTAGSYVARQVAMIGTRLPLVGGLLGAPLVSDAIAATWAAGMAGVLHLGVQGTAKAVDPTLSQAERDSGRRLMTTAGALGLAFLGATQLMNVGGDYVRNTGPGSWQPVNESMSEAARMYQEQVTGHTSTVGYVVNGVKFDSYDPNRGVLIDAKGGL